VTFANIIYSKSMAIKKNYIIIYIIRKKKRTFTSYFLHYF